MSNSRKTIVITGMGAVTPFGKGIPTLWGGLLSGATSSRRIVDMDVEQSPVQIACQVLNFDPEPYVDAKAAKRMDRFTKFAVWAASEAALDAGITSDNVDAERFGVVIGSGMGGIITIEEQHLVFQERGAGRLSAFMIPNMIANMAAGQVSMTLGAKGISTCVISACASGAHSIGEAAEVIQRGDADIMVAGGCDATISAYALGGFNACKALSRRNDAPERASRPFDKDRDGFVMGEGAGIVVLETLEHAQARGARIIAVLAGYGSTSDAFHITSPDPECKQTSRSMRMAIEKAGLTAADINYVNAHGTSTPTNDRLETKTIKLAVGNNVPVSSIKGSTGHLMGAAGAVEAIATILAIRDEMLPPTANYETPDPECDLDYVPNVARKAVVKAAISNSFGFGGHNASLLFTKF